jgi:hypothetical protein
MSKKLQQHGGHLVAGDIIRILDAESAGAIAVCVESDGHREYPYCCMVVSDRDREREELWPAEYVKLGNVNELVGLLEVLRTPALSQGALSLTGASVRMIGLKELRKKMFDAMEFNQPLRMEWLGTPTMKAKRKRKNP